MASRAPPRTGLRAALPNGLGELRSTLDRCLRGEKLEPEVSALMLRLLAVACLNEGFFDGGRLERALMGITDRTRGAAKGDGPDKVG